MRVHVAGVAVELAWWMGSPGTPVLDHVPHLRRDLRHVRLNETHTHTHLPNTHATSGPSRLTQLQLTDWQSQDRPRPLPLDKHDHMKGTRVEEGGVSMCVGVRVCS